MKITILTLCGLALCANLLLFAPLTPPQPAYASDPSPTPLPIPSIRSSPAVTRTYFFPLVFNQGITPCSAIPGQVYGSVAPSNPTTNPPAANNPDINISLRGFRLVNETKTLIEYAGGSDALAPQLATLFAPQRLPSFSSTWQIGSLIPSDPWITDPPVTLLGMRTTSGDIISTPASGYDIGVRPNPLMPDGFEAMVLYATDHRITLKYTREDDVVRGYTIHIEDICVEPHLLALYESLNGSGRTHLPALNSVQPFGRSRGNEIRVSIRDTGSFLDPRSHKDWWQGY